jgi:hypothetical protein
VLAKNGGGSHLMRVFVAVGCKGQKWKIPAERCIRGERETRRGDLALNVQGILKEKSLL